MRTAEELREAADAADKNCLLYRVEAPTKAADLFSGAIQNWGASIRISSAAPSWTKINKVIALFSEPQEIVLAVDEDGTGVLSTKPSIEQSTATQELLDEMKALAIEKGADPAVVEEASGQFRRHFQQLEFELEFSADSAEAAAEAFTSKSADAFSGPLRMTTPAAIGIQIEQIKEMAVKKPPKRNPDPAEIEARKAELEKNPPKPRYSSLGQMVKAGDAEALGEALEKLDKSDWNDDKQEMFDQLLWHAASGGHVEMAKLLIEKADAKLGHTDSNGVSAFAAACVANKPELMDYLLTQGANPNGLDVDGHTPLMLAAEADADLAVDKLLQMGCDIDQTTLEGRTALHLACIGIEGVTATKSVQLLMDAGADPTVSDDIECNKPHEYIDDGEKSVQTKADMLEYHSAWENGNRSPRKGRTFIAKARATLGF